MRSRLRSVAPDFRRIRAVIEKVEPRVSRIFKLGVASRWRGERGGKCVIEVAAERVGGIECVRNRLALVECLG